MDTLSVTLLIAAFFGLGFLLWTYTKPGKKWLKEL